MTEHDDARELAAGYALGSLTPDESARYEAYLFAASSDETTSSDESTSFAETSSSGATISPGETTSSGDATDARAEADEFASVAEALLAEAPPVQPSAALRSSILDAIAGLPQLSVQDAPAPASVDAIEHEIPAPISIVPPLLDREAQHEAEDARPSGVATPAERRAERRWFAKPATWLAAAAAAVALVVGGVTIAPIVGETQYRQQQEQALASIQEAPDAVEVSGTVASGETATVIWSGSLGKSVMMIDDLDPLPSDRTYELWYINSGGAIPAGTFDAVDDGTTWRVLDGAMSAGDSIGVTVEPKGGSDAPTTDPIVIVPTA